MHRQTAKALLFVFVNLAAGAVVIMIHNWPTISGKLRFWLGL